MIKFSSKDAKAFNTLALNEGEL